MWKSRRTVLAASFLCFPFFIGSTAGCNEIARAEDLPSGLHVRTDFSGGSGDVESIDQAARLIRIKPTPHPGHGWNCWWYFAVTEITPGETIEIALTGDRFSQPDQATFSIDGQTWLHTAVGERHDLAVHYRQRINAKQAWFAWGPPMSGDDAAGFIRTAAAKCTEAEPFELCRSRDNRPVMGLRLSPDHIAFRKGATASAASGAKPYGVFITARQHAWESGGSWVCRGLMEWLVSTDALATDLRNKALVQMVPVMDVDNVALGAGGKDEQPQDHNRDWTEHPFHPAVAAAQQEILRMNEAGKFDLFIDLHNPTPGDKTSVFFISPRNIMSDEGWNNLERFLGSAQAEMTGPIVFRGETRESGPGYDARWQQIGKNWVTQHTAGHVVSVTLETAWNTPESTDQGYMSVGRQLGLAIARYFREPPKRAQSD
jgi:hypothetical protein